MPACSCQPLAKSLAFLGRPSKMAQVLPMTFCDIHSSMGNARILALLNGQVPIHSLSVSLSFSLLHLSPVLFPPPSSPYPHPTVHIGTRQASNCTDKEDILPEMHLEHFLACDKGLINASYIWTMSR